MKLLKNLLGVAIAIMISVITFFSWNLIFVLVANHAAIGRTELAGMPMVLLMIELFVTLYGIFNYAVLKRRDAYMFRKYSIIIGCFALIGVISSIVTGTYVYHTFFGDYIFLAYPFVMLIVHAAFLGVAIYVAILSIRLIHKEHPERTWKNSKTYWIREVLMAFMLMFALEKFGAFVLLPVYWSSYDSIYTLPLIIQLLVPLFIFCTYMVDRHWKHNRKLTIWLLVSSLIYTTFSFTYMLIFAHNNYPLAVNSTSMVLQLERLLTIPVGFIFLYGFSILYPCITIVYNVVKIAKEKKAA